MSDWTPKRFWKDVHVKPYEEGFGIFLDARIVKTPAKRPMVTPRQELARAIAAEWEAVEGKVDPLPMRKTRMANSAIDTVADNFEHVVESLAAYGASDLLCYRAEGPADLVARQAEVWDRFLEWSAARLRAPLTVQTGVIPVEQPQESLEILRQKLTKQNVFALAALHNLVTLSGSCVLGLAATERDAKIADLWQAAILDENWSIDTWGADEELVEVLALKEKDFVAAYEFFHLA